MEILHYPNPALTAKNEPISYDTPGLEEKVKEMFVVMRAKNGIGLAAPQVGWNVKLFIVGIRNPATKELVKRVYLNPKVKPYGDQVLMDEACLSFPGMGAKIKRHTFVEVEYDDLDGRLGHAHLGGLWAQVIQHEYDHLEGVTLYDRMSPADRAKNKWVLEELEKIS